MPSAKKGKEAAAWALALLRESDEDREYDKRRANPGHNATVSYEPTKDAEALVKTAASDLAAVEDPKSSPEFLERFMELWTGVLTDAAAADAKGYVAQSFGDAIKHGPNGAWERFQEARGRMLSSALSSMSIAQGGGQPPVGTKA